MLPHTILNGHHTRTIPVKSCVIPLNGYGKEDLKFQICENKSLFFAIQRIYLLVTTAIICMEGWLLDTIWKGNNTMTI